MITIAYSVSCDNCWTKKEKVIVINNVIELQYSKPLEKVCRPVLPHGWLFQTANVVNAPDKLFCGPQCRKEYNEKKR